MDLKELIEGFNQMAKGAELTAKATRDIMEKLPDDPEQRAIVQKQLDSMADILKKAQSIVDNAVKG